MKATELLTDNRPPKLLIYGAGGAGKTGLVSQAAGALLLDFDRGMRSAATITDPFTPLRHQVEMLDCSENNPMQPNAWLNTKQLLLRILNESNAGKWKYNCLIVDSLSGLCETVQHQVMAQCNKPMGKPEIREWGLIVSEIENALSIIRALPCMVLVTAHELPIQLESGAHIMKILAPGSKLPAKIPFMFDEVWYAKTKSGPGNTTRYIVSGRKTSSIEARTRSGMNKDFDHTEVGLAGVLAEIGYDYNKTSV
jgi:hypothetical protein